MPLSSRHPQKKVLLDFELLFSIRHSAKDLLVQGPGRSRLCFGLFTNMVLDCSVVSLFPVQGAKIGLAGCRDVCTLPDFSTRNEGNISQGASEGFRGLRCFS